jgi:hypothetical protein
VGGWVVLVWFMQMLCKCLIHAADETPLLHVDNNYGKFTMQILGVKFPPMSDKLLSAILTFILPYSYGRRVSRLAFVIG